ncbi:MAG: HEPN domain-containing protein [Anaerolineae bacterium]
MREEADNNWRQAQEDMETARVLLETERFYASVFFSQQAAEKALKALYIEQKRELPKTHNLTALTRELSAPPEVLEAAQELTPDYLTTRYPNAANAVPAEIYNHNSAQMHLKFANEIISWVKNILS